jgi:hypothetical protein
MAEICALVGCAAAVPAAAFGSAELGAAVVAGAAVRIEIRNAPALKIKRFTSFSPSSSTASGLLLFLWDGGEPISEPKTFSRTI